MKKSGFTLIELLAVIIILAVIALIATPIILGIIDDTKKNAFKDTAYGISQAAKNAFVEIMYAGEEPKNIIYTYTDGTEASDPINYSLIYEGNRPSNGKISLTKEGKVALALHDGKWCASKGYNDAEIAIDELSLDNCNMIIENILNPDFSSTKGVNIPKLITGMTPIKWAGTTIVETTKEDPDWYNYTVTDKKWANVRTADGSIWVWIPRFAYQISTYYHISVTGTISIKFLKGNTNNSVDGTVIANQPVYSGNNQTNYILHPAFTFGGTQVTGIWVAKFEASNNGSNQVRVVPGVDSWHNQTIGTIFTKARSMETNSIYGWGTTGVNIDTHLMKNIEWGAVAYLFKSDYGKNTETSTNTSTTTGGGAGTAYVTNAAQSTTGNVYGIYDMNGGYYDVTSAYVNNGNSILTTAASELLSSVATNGSKYVDVYSKGATDSNTSNYTANANMKGDAIYETSNNPITNGEAWYNDESFFGNGSYPFMSRGGYSSTGYRGIFAFGYSSAVGYSWNYVTFRPVIMINTGL